MGLVTQKFEIARLVRQAPSPILRQLPSPPPAGQPAKKISNNQYYVDGQANIDYLGNIINIKFPDHLLYDTVGGFLISMLGRIPIVGSKLYFKGWMFEVKNSKSTKITQVLIEKIHNKKTDH